ncbi:MAG: hypothetical protein M1826_000755 [Phylliscum demangeonii]|nr:MAG: hypothetical protein M1826_000755 [Phylliscum demangeonii]
MFSVRSLLVGLLLITSTQCLPGKLTPRSEHDGSTAPAGAARELKPFEQRPPGFVGNAKEWRRVQVIQRLRAGLGHKEGESASRFTDWMDCMDHLAPRIVKTKAAGWHYIDGNFEAGAMSRLDELSDICTRAVRDARDDAWEATRRGLRQQAEVGGWHHLPSDDETRTDIATRAEEAWIRRDFSAFAPSPAGSQLLPHWTPGLHSFVNRVGRLGSHLLHARPAAAAGAGVAAFRPSGWRAVEGAVQREAGMAVHF